MPRTSRLLIANRGEIAVRIARTARRLGIATVVAHPADDADSPHVRAADAAHLLPGAGPSAYLSAHAVVAAAVDAGCDAVHPGYGFLSEDPGLARACRDAGLVFVGPGTGQLETFGSKVAARAAAVAAGVPVLDGSDGPVDVAGARDVLDRVLAGGGVGVMVKAVAGGGGRGMRPVADVDELEAAVAAARREAGAAFGREEVFVEELVVGARHVEVQVVGDGDRAEHLHTRDCTLQRRRQKLVEVAPAWSVEPGLRTRIEDAAVRLAESVGYDSLGTVEVLVAGDRFAFLELNARLQVEHTVTEAICGLDLVELQLRLAEGQRLADVGLWSTPPARGVAVQARVAMERVGADGEPVPTGGTVTGASVPDGVRLDTFAEDPADLVGYRTSSRYDSLLAKLVVHRVDGDPAAALADAADALDELRIEGVGTNAELLAAVLRHPDVREGRIDTTWLEGHAAELAPLDPPRAGATVDRSDPLAVLEHGRRDGPTGSAVPAPDRDDPGTAVAPVAGTVVEVAVEVGDEVAAGATVAVLEAMKMEHVVAAPVSGTVRRVHVALGEAVGAGTPVVALDPGQVAAADVTEEAAVDLDHVRPDLAEARARHAIGLDDARPEAVARRRRFGKRTARENLADLVDEGSFLEYGPLVVAAQRKRRSLEELRERTPADGLVGGLATVAGAPVAVASYDYTVLAGTQGLQNHRKKDRLFDVAHDRRLPVVLFAEGGGGRPGDTDGTGVAGLDCLAFHWFGRLSGLVPLVGVASGRCFAGNAALLGCCDVVIATEDANIGMGGPAMIEGGGLGVHRPEEIGPAADQVRSGVIDVLVADEAEATDVARRYLGYFTHPQLDPDAAEVADQRLLRRVVPEQRLRAYEVRDVLDVLFDVGSVLELRRGFGEGMVTALARLGGRAVGVLANDPTHLAGAIDADAADKAARFLQLCDAHDLPVVSLCDTPGIMVGPEAERTGLVRHAARLFTVTGSMTVPIMTVVLRKGYGLGAQAMAGGSFHAPLFTVGWPTSEFGGMGLEGAVKLGYRNELAAIEDPDERRRTFDEMVERMYEVGKGTSMAAAFEIDDVIDPADTRRWLLGGLATTPVAPRDPRGPRRRPHVDPW